MCLHSQSCWPLSPVVPWTNQVASPGLVEPGLRLRALVRNLYRRSCSLLSPAVLWMNQVASPGSDGAGPGLIALVVLKLPGLPVDAHFEDAQGHRQEFPEGGPRRPGTPLSTD